MVISRQLRAGVVIGFPVHKISGGGEELITALKRNNIKQVRFRVVRRRKPVRRPVDSRADGCAFLGGNTARQDGTARGVDASCPVQLLNKGAGAKKLTRDSIENIEKAVPVGVKKQVAQCAVLGSVGQYRCFS